MTSRTARAGIVLLAAAVAFGVVGVRQVEITRTRALAQEAVPGAVAPSAGPASGPGAPSEIVRTIAPTRGGRLLECSAGRNGGATDVGVTATKIRLATTAVLDGPAASLLSSSPVGMKAVINAVNRGGGICGRQLELTVVNDGFDAQKGQLYIRNFINEGYFALPVVPSAEGLSAAILSKDISRGGIPVVGSDGMRIDQYRDPWVWPVAAATVSTMRVAATYGYRERGARTFAIVWDNKYKFGVEGAEAFKSQVRKLGGRVVADVKLNPDQPSYASEAEAFNQACRGGCDMVMLLLLPDTAQKWMARRPTMGKKISSGAQTLFTDQFAQACVLAAGELCHELVVWTGYNPPVGRHIAVPGVARFVDDVKAIAPNVDVRNQFLEGAYLGMSVFVEALRRVGPNLTRPNLRRVLDSMDYTSELASTLRWRSGRHHANSSAQAFALIVNEGNFSGWRDLQTGWIRDPGLGG